MINQTLLLQQVEAIREQSEQFLLDTAYIKRKVSSTVTRGVPNVVYADPVEIACRLINRSGADETPIASQFRAVQITTNVSIYRMQLPYDTELGIEDLIVYNGQDYDVVHVPAKHSLMGAFIVYLQLKT